MFLAVVLQEENETTKILEYEGDYTTKDLEEIYLDLIDTKTEWLRFNSKPNGFVTRKAYIKTIYLREQKQT